MTENDLKRFLNTTGIDASRLGQDTPLISCGLLDSTAVMQVVMMIEERLGRELEADCLTAENFDSIGAILELYRRCADRRKAN